MVRREASTKAGRGNSPVSSTRSVRKSLAIRLALNHIHQCFPPELWSYASRLLVGSPRIPQYSRVVVVTGAGLTLDAGIPDATRALGHIKKRLQTTKDFDVELERLAVQYRLQPNEFETQLLALSKYHAARIPEVLEDIFHRRFYPSFATETLAHMLKHRFVDAIINFNFDELLDQALDDEVGPENYHTILSDGDIPTPMSGLQDDLYRLKEPLYIKPHGSASHKSTMRFTREAYYLLPSAIHQLLLDLLTSAPTTLVIIGFGMRSVEFTRIVEMAGIKQKLQVFLINPDPGVESLIPSTAKLAGRIYPRKDLGSSLRGLSNDVGQRFNEQARPRGLNRHVLVGSLLGSRVDYTRSEDRRKRALRTYLRDRTVLEIALAVAKAKGFVNLNQLATTRAGRYYTEYRRRAGKRATSLQQICRSLKLARWGYSSEALKLRNDRRAPFHPRDDLTLKKQEWKKAMGDLIEATVRCLSPYRRRLAQRPAIRTLLSSTFQYLYANDEVETCVPKSMPYQVMFSLPSPIASLGSMKLETESILRSDWTRLFCVAESGQWLLDPRLRKNAFRRSLEGRSIFIIVADLAFQDRLQRFFSGLRAEISIRHLHWWQHNQHMTLALTETGPLRGIYYERRMRSLSIAPVLLRGSKDKKNVLDIFLAYWVKAQKFEKNEDVVISERDLARAKAYLLDGRRRVSP